MALSTSRPSDMRSGLSRRTWMLVATIVVPILGFIVNAVAMAITGRRGESKASLIHGGAALLALVWPALLYLLIDPGVSVS